MQATPGGRKCRYHYKKPWWIYVGLLWGSSSLSTSEAIVTVKPFVALVANLAVHGLPHGNTMPWSLDMTHYDVTVYRHRFDPSTYPHPPNLCTEVWRPWVRRWADLSLCYPWLLGATEEATKTHLIERDTFIWPKQTETSLLWPSKYKANAILPWHSIRSLWVS